MNHLARETSPYLRQHAENPVDWFPFGTAAFARAAELERPLLISIGYSSCHWCHVMAHESFEDEETAALINATFVAVKVDREERPDVDAVYMEAVQAIAGHGGWPLNVFATPDGRPFFGGTYFPKRSGSHMPAFKEVLAAVADAWTTKRPAISRQADELTDRVSSRLAPPPGNQHAAASELAERALERAEALFDEENGGIGDAPKFPQAPLLELVLACGRKREGRRSEVVTTSLLAMASGGIYDHLGGGFARYAVDRAWRVPHFEKMLYDQASLARLYLHAFEAGHDHRFLQVATETLDYVLRDLAGPGGSFYSSEDADSSGEEGRFYTWTRAELEAVLGGRADDAAQWYGVFGPPALEGGRYVLYRPMRGDIERPENIEELRRILFAARAVRDRPGRDDKVLTEWNAQFCSTLSEAAAATGSARYRQAAEANGDFLLTELRRKDGRWLRSWQDGRAAHLAVDADYAWLVDCFTRLYELSGDYLWIDRAVEVADGLLTHFAAEGGGFYSTGDDADELCVRPRDLYDGSTPSGSSVAALALVRLGVLVDDDRFTRAATGSVEVAGSALASSPAALPTLLMAALLEESGPVSVAVPGPSGSLVRAVGSAYLPEVVLAHGERPVSLLGDRERGMAYVCRRGACLLPVGEVDGLFAALGELGA